MLKVSVEHADEIFRILSPDWLARSKSRLLQSYGNGVFVWDSENDRRLRSSGKFYPIPWVHNYFSPETTMIIREMAATANFADSLVGALILPEKIVGKVISKSAVQAYISQPFHGDLMRGSL